MTKLLYALTAVAVLTSCANSYNVEGSSSVSSLDGSKLYLKTVTDNELQSLDSCAVLHGEFHFSGVLDTVRMATLFMDNEGLLPVVLEKGDIRIKIDNAGQSVSGTPMNDRLYEFLDKHKQLANQMGELSHKQSQMLLDGIDEAVINETLSAEAAKITREEDRLVTTFIVDNFDNVLGPGVFMMITSGFRYPILTPQIEDIMSKATDKFKKRPLRQGVLPHGQRERGQDAGIRHTPRRRGRAAQPVAACRLVGHGPRPRRLVEGGAGIGLTTLSKDEDIDRKRTGGE